MYFVFIFILEVFFFNDLEVLIEEDKIIIYYNYGVLEKLFSV